MYEKNTKEINGDKVRALNEDSPSYLKRTITLTTKWRILFN